MQKAFEFKFLLFCYFRGNSKSQHSHHASGQITINWENKSTTRHRITWKADRWKNTFAERKFISFTEIMCFSSFQNDIIAVCNDKNSHILVLCQSEN